MVNVSEEDKDGFINLNVRVHREDIIDALGEESECPKCGADLPADNDTPCAQCGEKNPNDRKISPALFKAIAQLMSDNEPFSGGDMWSDACREAYEACEGD